MNTNPLFVILLLLFASGCASVDQRQTAAPTPLTSKTLTASGYAQFQDGGMQFRQRWLTTQQAAKLNAFRALADQLYDEALADGKTVGSQVVGNEAYRIYLDGYLREAKATDYHNVKDTLKVSLSLNLTPTFYQCMSGEPWQIEQCLREDGKLELTRLGFKPAQTTTVNLACGNRDCSDQFYVQGFSKEVADHDAALLKVGMYPSGRLLNSFSRAAFNLILIQGLINAI